MSCKATWRGTRESQEAEGAGGKHSKSFSLWFRWEGMSDATSTGLGLGSWNNFSRFLSCLVPGPEIIRNIDLEFKSSIEEVWLWDGWFALKLY